VPAAIQFQERNHWEEVRSASHELDKEAQRHICELTGIPPIHSGDDSWFAQISAAPLPADTDIVLVKSRLYDEYRIEVPLIVWNKM